MDGTVTGRLSCANPNLQALPRDDELFGIKGAIKARPNYKLLQADYSQAEVRLVAHYSGDHNLIRMINSGVDSHQFVADEIGVTRQVGKTLNFSVIYGVGAFTLSERLNCSEQQAESFLKAYHTRYPGFKRVYETSERMAHKYRFITMWSRRRRHYNLGPYLTPYRKGSSNLIQGGVGELLRERQTAVHMEMQKYGVEQVLQVHDSAVMEVPADDVLELAKRIKELMEDRTRFKVPFVVDINWGDNLTCKEGKL
jgi:DNA polymerase-1